VPTPVPVSPGTVVLRPIEAIPDTARLSPAELPYVHPLYRPLDTPPRLLDRGPVQDLETRVWLYVTAKVGENGRVSDGPPSSRPPGARHPAPDASPRWRFNPARQGGKPVATWASYAAS